MAKLDVYLEIGKTRVFACALAWPGWSRLGRDEPSALQALLESAPRYAAILHAAQIDFRLPTTIDAFPVVERLLGSASTDFGAPDSAPSVDGEAMSDGELARAQSLLTAYWQAFDVVVEQAKGSPLRKGPRGGGRGLEGIVQHVIDAETSYLRRLNWKLERQPEMPQGEQLALLRQAERDALASAQQGNLPESGPRGGKLWTPRYFVRRSGWHTLDHLWEIEDRSQDNPE